MLIQINAHCRHKNENASGVKHPSPIPATPASLAHRSGDTRTRRCKCSFFVLAWPSRRLPGKGFIPCFLHVRVASSRAPKGGAAGALKPASRQKKAPPLPGGAEKI